MTTFAELVSATMDVTKRPALTALTNQAVRLAVMRAHHTDFFPRDTAIGSIPYQVSPVVMFYDFQNMNTVLPRLRQIQTVYGKTQEGLYVEQLEYRKMSNLYDNDGEPLRYVYTLIGETLRCYFDMPTGLIDVVYFRNPQVQELQFSSWIADEYRDEVAHWAAAIVFARSGFQDMAASLVESHINPFKQELIANYLNADVN